MSPLRPVATLLGRAGLLLATVAALNVVVDPFGAHGTSLLDPIVLSSRRPKLHLYRRASPPPEVVVLGSSRSFEMEPSAIERSLGRPAFNAAVQAAVPQDYEDFASCFEQMGRFPAVLILGLGIEQMLAGDGAPGEPDDPLAACRPSTGRVPRSLLALESTLTLQETQGSVRSLLLQARGHREPMTVFGSDGARLRATAGSFDLDRALEDSLAGSWSPRCFAAEFLAPSSSAHLARLFEACRRHQARVVVYLPPYHPRALRRYRAESHFDSLHAQILRQLADWQRRYAIHVHDFTEVAAFGGTADMFYDASHPSEEAGRLMTAAIAQDLR